jgi:hypothetical protein
VAQYSRASRCIISALQYWFRPIKSGDDGGVLLRRSSPYYLGDCYFAPLIARSTASLGQQSTFSPADF